LLLPYACSCHLLLPSAHSLPLLLLLSLPVLLLLRFMA
jgi:hypothetical protein